MTHRMIGVKEFAEKYPGWHGYAKDPETELCVQAAVDAGHVEVNEFHQFRAKQKGVEDVDAIIRK